jgi:hypothetical protein
MRFIWGAPPDDPDFRPNEEGWIQVKFPNPTLLIVVAFPIGVLVAYLLLLGWQTIIPHGMNVRWSLPPGVGYWGFLLLPLLPLTGLFFVFLAHELLHAVGHPGCGLSSASFIGFWPRRLLFYATYHGGIKRDRNLMLGMLPILVLSVFPLAACAVFDTHPGPHTLLLAFVSVANGFSSCGDLLFFPMILAQVPRDATLRDQGWDMFWKVEKDL